MLRPRYLHRENQEARGDMFFEHFFEEGLAHKSYLVGCEETGEAIVIDPRRDVDAYLRAATAHDLRITRITETHIHADYLSGTRELAAATGAEVLLSDEGGADWQYRFEHTGLHGGDSIDVGRLRLDVLHVPGHTPEAVAFVLHDCPTGPEAVMVFTGDTVFVGDVGRPDLVEATTGDGDSGTRGTRDLWKSIGRLRDLPEYVMVWPAHGAGSACGKSLGSIPVSTIGYEIATNWAFRVGHEDQFADQLLDGQPETPHYFSVMKTRNRAGAPVMGTIPALRKLTAEEVAGHRGSAQCVDTRSRYAYAGGHIPDSVAIPMGPSFGTWAGWMLSYDRPIVLIAADHEVDAVMTALFRIGFDTVVGYLDSIDPWVTAGRPIARTAQIDASEFLVDENAYTVLDVRSQAEFAAGHLEGAQHIYAGHLDRAADRIPDGRPLLVHCQAGYRSIIAASVLERLGVEDVVVLAGGYDTIERARRSAQGIRHGFSDEEVPE
jgi:hydroxyacylglutathione hydrolase